jgi:hypothetical protein
MAVNTAKRKQLVAEKLAARKGNEPTIDVDNYNVSIGSALTWYTEHATEKQLLKYALEYLVNKGCKAGVLAVNKASDYEVRQLGIICRLANNEQPLSDKHTQFITDTVDTLVRKYKVVKEKKAEMGEAPSNVISIQQRMEEKAHDLAAEIDAAIDDFVTNKSSTFSTKNYLLANSVAAPIAKRIGEFYVDQLAEIREAIAGDDEQLVEGYSHFTKRELKKFAEFLESIITDCQQQVQTAKATRAPRKRKEVPPSKQVAKIKFMREFPELNLKSVKPETIIGSGEVWVYNTKYRKVTVYKAENGTVAVKGTTIIGFSVKESQTLLLRKPEEFFKGLSLGKRALNGAVKKLTTKPTVPNGRINEECIILGAF